MVQTLRQVSPLTGRFFSAAVGLPIALLCVASIICTADILSKLSEHKSSLIECIIAKLN
jgi:hypothetical protein